MTRADVSSKKIVRWNMPVLRESPLYLEILQEGMQQGLQQGLQQGIQQGALKAHRQTILGFLRARLDLSATDLGGIARQLERIEDESALQELVFKAAQVTSLQEFQSCLRG